MKVANCISVYYESGEYQTRQGYKGGGYGNYFSKGRVHQLQGNGWAKTYKPSKLILNVEIEQSYYEIWIDHFFKNHVEKLNENRVNAIKSSMPEIISVHECMSAKGGIYYTADECDLENWKKCSEL